MGVIQHPCYRPGRSWLEHQQTINLVQSGLDIQCASIDLSAAFLNVSLLYLNIKSNLKTVTATEKKHWKTLPWIQKEQKSIKKLLIELRLSPSQTVKRNIQQKLHCFDGNTPWDLSCIHASLFVTLCFANCPICENIQTWLIYLCIPIVFTQPDCSSGSVASSD